LTRHGLDERHKARRDAQAPARRSKKRDEGDEDAIEVPEVVARMGRRALGRGQRLLYEKLLETRVTGRAHVPPMGGYIVAANHASHLDMGLVKHALGEH